MKKIIKNTSIFVLVLFLIGYFLFSFDLESTNKKKLSNDEINRKISEETVVEKAPTKIQVSNNDINETIVDDTNSDSIASYKDVFIEPKKNSSLEKYQEESSIEQLNKDAEQLIKDAENFVKNNNIKSPKEKISPKEKEELKRFEEEINEMQKQLEELNNEN